uniref:Guanine nucleotide-binding protein subunit alpha-11-like n=1 Tax=Sinocyclocheilus rhinocerous TaxID=307959 RepID=A0A673J9K0_9TELE
EALRVTWQRTENVIYINNEIKRILAEQKKRQWRDIKVLLLGTGESGKTTFMKQMKIIHGSGYSEDERRGYTKLVFQNVFQAMSAMTDAMKMLKIPYSSPQNEVIKRPSVSCPLLTTCIFVYFLFPDANACTECYANKAFIISSVAHGFSVRVFEFSEGYIPTPQDVLQVRFPTTGISDHCFTLEKMTLRIVDVGGQRGQRRKWIHCFENVTSLIFLASLSEYDQLLEENNKDNRMEESLSLFYTTIHSMWFANSSIILFLNKTDIMAEKIQFSDLKTYFPEFNGRRRDIQDAMLFIRNLYRQRAVSFETKNSKNIFPHFTCATDTKNIRKVFSDMKETVLVKALEDCGMF